MSKSQKRVPREAGQMLSLQQKVQQSHDCVFRAVYKFPVLGNDFDNRKQNKRFWLFEKFSFPTFGGILKTTRIESKDYLGIFLAAMF